MPDATVDALNEIAALMRRRVEQTEEATKRSIEQMERMRANNPLEKPEYAKRMEEQHARMERSYADMERLRAEEQEFRERLLATLTRQNEVLDAILARLK
jgi:hypothetical protein